MPKLDQQEENEVNTKPEKKKRVPIKALIVLLILILVCGSGFVFWRTRANGNPEQDTSGPAVFIAPMEFTVNLADPGQRRYLKATLALATSQKSLEKEIAERKPEIRDLIIELFRSRTVSDLSTLAGTDRLREEIKTTINSRLMTGAISDVYFTEFIIQ